MKKSLIALAMGCAVAGSAFAFQGVSAQNGTAQDIPTSNPPHFVQQDIPTSNPPHFVQQDIPTSNPPHAVVNDIPTSNPPHGA
jgi:hypothetical protein